MRKFDCSIYGMRRARELGLMHQVDGANWQLTPAGFAFAEGRVLVTDRRTGRMGRGGCHLVATWLAALPLPNIIRLNGCANPE